jgi:hypothetical protein
MVRQNRSTSGCARQAFSRKSEYVDPASRSSFSSGVSRGNQSGASR